MLAAVSPGGLLRESVKDATLQVPGAPNALAARLIEREGYAAAYFSGAALSAGVMAMPDVGLFTLTELAQQARYVCQSTRIPVIVDADTGFGEADNVARTIVELERAGAAAVQLEDQQFPKRCGHLAGKTLIETDHMCEKIAAAVEAKQDQELVLIARTDARAVEGMPEALLRAKKYVEAGADWIFPEALQSKEEFQEFADTNDVPLIANMTEFGKSPLLSLGDLAQLGYACVLYPVTLLRIAMKAMETALALIGDEGSQASLLDLMQTREELYELLEYEP